MSTDTTTAAVSAEPVCRRRGCRNSAAYTRQGRRGLCGACYREYKDGTLTLPPEKEVTDPLGGMCRHCREKPGVIGRGLCRACYNDQDIRKKYPKKKTAPTGRDTFRRPPIPDETTDAAPGSEEKIFTLMRRLRQGSQLHHPDDERIDNPVWLGGLVSDENPEPEPEPEEAESADPRYQRIVDDLLPAPGSGGWENGLHARTQGMVRRAKLVATSRLRVPDPVWAIYGRPEGEPAAVQMPRRRQRKVKPKPVPLTVCPTDAADVDDELAKRIERMRAACARLRA